MTLAQKIKNRIGGQPQHNNYNEQALVEIHHTLMKVYGWIPLEEFKQLPNPTLHNLLWCIKRDNEQEQKQYDKVKRK